MLPPAAISNRTRRWFLPVTLAIGLALGLGVTGANAQSQMKLKSYDAIKKTPGISKLANPHNLCSWFINNGTSFGQSGFCDAGSAQVGSKCQCPGIRKPSQTDPWFHPAPIDGVVIAAPSGNGNPQVVR